jgi:RNA polymerase sigma-70 factor (ECF subfamily)
LRPPFAEADSSAPRSDADWLALFQRGDKRTLQDCYLNHFATVQRAIRGILDETDQEMLIHELFSRLIARAELRRSFQGGSFAAWLATVARNQAIDYQRRIGRERALSEADCAERSTHDWEQETHARLLIEKFRRERLPADWNGVFELRFLTQLPQREAASQLGMHRTTLAYREIRIRSLLKRFLLEGDES